VDFKRACIGAKTVGVAAAHDIAAAKVGVAQKPCQLHPGLKRDRRRREKLPSARRRWKRKQAYVQEKGKGQRGGEVEDSKEKKRSYRLWHRQLAGKKL
jgi:hypothetical protein